jgi:hypothetical protein
MQKKILFSPQHTGVPLGWYSLALLTGAAMLEGLQHLSSGLQNSLPMTVQTTTF